jgi:stalled ribosome rescue protein Dom34
MSPKNYRRGYPVAILVGVEADHAVIWQIYSHVAKQKQTVRLNGNRNDQKATYNFHEAIINALRPTLKEGIHSVIVASPPRTSYAQDLKKHILSHHPWLTQGTNKTTISLIAGSASTPPQISTLAQKPEFKELINENATQETENLLEILEKRLNKTGNLVLFSLEEAENFIFNPQPEGKPQPDYLLLTDKYLASTRQKSRLHKLMQVSQNMKVKTRVINAESNAGARLTQFGGIVCLAK